MAGRLRIVSVNDVYSLENLPRLRSLVAHHATHDPADALLVVLAGDFLAPSILSSLDGGRGMVDCLNRVPITHVVLGNHEDDLDTDTLRARLRELNATVLATNLRGFDDALPTHDVIVVGDVRVGLVGVLDGDPTLYRRPPFAGATIAKANETACREAERLLAEGCTSVIAITHQRVADDRALARMEPRLPVILGGHEHDGLLEEIDGTWLVKAPAEADRAVIVDLEWADRASPPTVRARFEDVADHEEDEPLRRRVDKHMTRVRELETATLLLLPEGQGVSSIGTRKQQTSMGTLLCSRLRDALGAEGCVFNGGGIRGAREYQGQFTYGDLKTEVPFDNEIVVVHLPGRVVREAVAASRAKAPAESGGFLQVDDRMRVDATNEVVEIDGAPLDPERRYRIALVRNLFEGMDHVEPLVRFAREDPQAIPMATSGREVKVVLVAAFAAKLWEQLGGLEGVDADRDGAVTKQELVDAIARVARKPPSEMAAQLVLDAIDHDRDGKITREDAGTPEA